MGKHSRLSNIFHNMRKRCYYINSKDYCNYGAKGITICAEWLKTEKAGINNCTKGFMAFKEWAIANGYDYKPDWVNGKYQNTLTLDRINPYGDYEPNNCRWVDNFTQANNKRNNVYLTYKNETKTVHQWEKIVGIKANTIEGRLRLGWSVERALTEKSYIGKNQYSNTPEQIAEMKSLWREYEKQDK